MISKKVFTADGVNKRFLSDFIIQSEQFARPYAYVYDNTLNPNGSEDVLQDPGSDWNFPNNLYRRGTDAPDSGEDLLTVDKWDLVDNSVLTYETALSPTHVWIEVATTPEEFGDTLTAPSVERAEEAADQAAASAVAAAISETNAGVSETNADLDAQATAADAVQTGLDATSTAADKASVDARLDTVQANSNTVEQNLDLVSSEPVATQLANAQDNADDANDSELEAGSWANENVDVPVKEYTLGAPSDRVPTVFSAKHYATKATSGGTARTSARNVAISASASGVLAESSTPTPSHKDIIYTGNGTSQDIVTGLPSVSRPWVASASYTIGDYKIHDYIIYEALTTHTGVATTPDADATNWVAIADGVVVDADNSDIWFKGRSIVSNNRKVNTLSGNLKMLLTDTTNAEQTQSTGITSFNTDGFSIGSLSDLNGSGQTFVAWCEYFDKMVSGVTANGKRYVEAYNAQSGKGMRIRVGSGAVDTVPHSLGTKIDFNVSKDRDAIQNWYSYNAVIGSTEYTQLNRNDASVAGSTIWNDTEPTENIFTFGSSAGINVLNNNYIDYYSSNRKNHSYVGGYVGTGVAGNPVDVGMDLLALDTAGKSIKVMAKSLDAIGQWFIMDSSRGFGTGVLTKYLRADTTDVEASATTVECILTNTGVSIGTTSTALNTLGGQYLIEVTVEDYDNPNGGLDIPADSVLSYAEGTDATSGDLDSIEATTLHDDITLVPSATNYIFMDKGNLVGSTIYTLIKEKEFTVTDANSDSYDVSEGLLRLATTGAISSRVYLGEVVVDASGDIIPETLIEYQVKHLDVAELEVHGDLISHQVASAYVKFNTVDGSIDSELHIKGVAVESAGVYLITHEDMGTTDFIPQVSVTTSTVRLWSYEVKPISKTQTRVKTYLASSSSSTLLLASNLDQTNDARILLTLFGGKR